MQDIWADPGHRASGGFDHSGLENGVRSMDTLGSHCRLEYTGYVRICTAEPSSSEVAAARGRGLWSHRLAILTMGQRVLQGLIGEFTRVQAKCGTFMTHEMLLKDLGSYSKRFTDHSLRRPGSELGLGDWQDGGKE